MSAALCGLQGPSLASILSSTDMWLAGTQNITGLVFKRRVAAKVCAEIPGALSLTLEAADQVSDQLLLRAQN